MKPRRVAADDVREVRCPSRMHFKIIDGERIEIKCNHRSCTLGDSIVLHRYSFNGELLETLRVQDPERKLRK